MSRIKKHSSNHFCLAVRFPRHVGNLPPGSVSGRREFHLYEENLL